MSVSKQKVKTEEDVKNGMSIDLIVKAIKGVVPYEFRKEHREFFDGRTRNFDRWVRKFVWDNIDEFQGYSLECITGKSIEELKEYEGIETELFDDEILLGYSEQFKRYINNEEIKKLSEKI